MFDQLIYVKTQIKSLIGQGSLCRSKWVSKAKLKVLNPRDYFYMNFRGFILFLLCLEPRELKWVGFKVTNYHLVP